MQRPWLTVTLGLACSGIAHAQGGPGLALTPPMGWNSWNKFGCDVSEKLLEEVADALVSSGMRDAGYRYVVIDDGWQVRGDEHGRIVADPDRFPSGMKALADYVHGKGLKFGLYSDAGTGTCQKRPGSKGYEELDARTYAEWGVDYLKYDWCNTEGQNLRDAYGRMSRALRASGRPIVLVAARSLQFLGCSCLLAFSAWPRCAHSFCCSGVISVGVSPAGTELHRMVSSNPGAEKMKTRLIGSVPTFFKLIQVLAGMNTRPPA